ncbi:MAG: hypothetical protein ABR586_04185 [Thermoplasmatota archaeon]
MTRSIEAGSLLHSCWGCGQVFDSDGNAARHEQHCLHAAVVQVNPA